MSNSCTQPVHTCSLVIGNFAWRCCELVCTAKMAEMVIHAGWMMRVVLSLCPMDVVNPLFWQMTCQNSLVHSAASMVCLQSWDRSCAVLRALIADPCLTGYPGRNAFLLALVYCLIFCDGKVCQSSTSFILQGCTSVCDVMHQGCCILQRSSLRQVVRS